MEEGGGSEMSSTPQQQQQQEQQQQKLTIFYDGKICVSDVTDLQARWILMAANREMEERVKTPNANQEMYSPTMKRSLQAFLQKRRSRIQEASPYNNNDDH
ncbi:protein TIFY 5A [Senna tora]|uniref:Protein TIFY n=1 Tax=Senna tora TaxID=362788 RepID=A0A834XEM6_9FABA|nr:protein TIFY 5A [Senna tora]